MFGRYVRNVRCSGSRIPLRLARCQPRAVASSILPVAASISPTRPLETLA